MNRYFPSEWHPQWGVMLTWPHDLGPWAEVLDEADKTFACIGQHISEKENLLVVCRDEPHHQHITHCLAAQNAHMQRIIFHYCDSDDSWARDHGPITVQEQGQNICLDFQFNAWGNKFPWDKDNRINTSLRKNAAFKWIQFQSVDFVLEGGALECDGKGTLLCTRNSVLNSNRNSVSTKDTEALLKQELGVENILWLQNGSLIGDDTDSHIDTLARFCNENLIAYQSCDQDDEHFFELKKMEQELAAFRTPDGRPYELCPLPLPKAIYDSDGRRLPAGYANFLIINGAVLMPAYNDPQDKVAAAVLSRCFPDRQIISIDCRILIQEFGSLHCVTMQIPNTLAS